MSKRLRAHGPRSRLAPLVLLHDRDRTPDIIALAEQLGPGTALIYREAVGAHDDELAWRLRRATRETGAQLLIGTDAGLAERVGADGVHFGRDALSDARALRTRRPGWIVTAAAPRTGPLAALDGLDAALVSAVFASRSASAGTPLGVEAFSDRVAVAPCPVFALGGITADTAPALIGSGASGLAAIDGLAQTLRGPTMQSAANPPNKGQGPIDAEPKGRVSVSKEEGGEMVIYTATVTGETATGELTLRRIADGVWNANHTGVPNAIGGRGVGKALVQAMSEDARAQGWTIRPGCPFVAKLFERRPELAAGIT